MLDLLWAFWTRNDDMKRVTWHKCYYLVYIKHLNTQLQEACQMCVRGILKKRNKAGHRWLTSAMMVTWEAEIRRIKVWSQPRQIVQEILSRKNHSQKRAGRVARCRPWV
jgi:hypothetical protein